MIDSNDVAYAVDAARGKYEFSDKAVEIQTAKAAIKAVPCIGCARPLIVSTFYVPANARCAACKTGNRAGVVTAPVPGKTDAAVVEDMTKVLVNHEFARALCPVRPDDEEHEMELKWVGHSQQHGPSEVIGWKDGVPLIRQFAVGETVMHQCLKCRAVVTYSTTAQGQFKRQNEVRTDKRVSDHWAADLGVREEVAV